VKQIKTTFMYIWQLQVYQFLPNFGEKKLKQVYVYLGGVGFGQMHLGRAIFGHVLLRSHLNT